MSANLAINQTKFDFPVGYFAFHKDKHINYHLNRWYSLGYWSKADVQKIGQDIQKTSDSKQVLIGFAEQMKAENRDLAAAIGYRAVEFFSHPRDADKLPLYDQFHDHFYLAVKEAKIERFFIPFRSGSLPALRLTPGNSKGTVIINGGLDSFMEELFSAADYLFAAGYEVILFEGPGQGAALRKSNLYMTYQWEDPVTAVLDYFELSDVTLIGLSLGGYLVFRAAAFDERITRVVAFDVFIYDQHGRGLQRSVYEVFLKYPSLYNWVARTAMRWSVSADHLISQWMYVTNASSPAEYVAMMEHYSVSDIAAQVHQDVLLLAGEKDHMIPLKEYHHNWQGFTNARSLTGRIFTSDEQAENHCQVGNIKLALDVILRWVDEKT
jgi:pimeloyl-ACP methyl ester carboxylesterase